MAHPVDASDTAGAACTAAGAARIAISAAQLSRREDFIVALSERSLVANP